MSYIRFENISKSYGENEVLKNVNLEVEKGQLVTLLGPSGCGKSTLLRCLAGLETVTQGKIYLDGVDITNVNPRERGIGMVFQQYSLFPNMTVEQNVGFGLKMKKTEKRVIAQKVDRVLEIVGLADKKKHYPSQLSGGQQQRAALARAIVAEPKVLLLDEPLSAIDALLRRTLQTQIRRIQQELGITAIFVTHDQDEAMVISDEIHLMYQGQIEQSAKPMELYTGPATKFAASFIGHYNMLSTEEIQNVFGQKMVAVTLTPQETENLQTKGTVVSCLPHGNIIRYGVNCQGIQIDVDVLFDSMDLIPLNQEVYLQVGTYLSL